MEANRAKLGDKLAYSEAEAARLLGLREHQLRDARLAGKDRLLADYRPPHSLHPRRPPPLSRREPLGAKAVAKYRRLHAASSDGIVAINSTK